MQFAREIGFSSPMKWVRPALIPRRPYQAVARSSTCWRLELARDYRFGTWATGPITTSKTPNKGSLRAAKLISAFASERFDGYDDPSSCAGGAPCIAAILWLVCAWLPGGLVSPTGVVMPQFSVQVPHTLPQQDARER